MHIEDLVRAAQERQADGAVPADRIRTALPRRVARAAHRRRLSRYGAVVAAAAVAAAVTVPTLAVRHTAEPVAPPAKPAVPTTAVATPSPTATPFRVFALGYRPTWAPPGFAERIRSADTGAQDPVLGPAVVRVWKKQAVTGDPWGGTELMLYVRAKVPNAAAAMDTSGKTIDINGVPGHYSGAQGDHKSYVDWSPDAHTVLTLSANHLDISQRDLLRMARSVRPDPATDVAPVRLPGLPADWFTTNLVVSGPSAAKWRGELQVTRDADPSTTKHEAVPNLTVIVGSTTDAPAGGDKLTVGGHPARHPVRSDLPGQSLLYLVVDLGQGRLMTLVTDGGNLTLADLAKVAEQAEVDSTGPAWLG